MTKSYDISKPFLAFAYDTYYPAGGIWDFVGSYNSYDEAMQDIRNQCEDRSLPDTIEIYENVNGILEIR